MTTLQQRHQRPHHPFSLPTSSTPSPNTPLTLPIALSLYEFECSNVDKFNYFETNSNVGKFNYFETLIDMLNA